MHTTDVVGLAGITVLGLAYIRHQGPLEWMIARLQELRAVGMTAGVAYRHASYAARIHWPICLSDARQTKGVR